jgi:hypothetical protein
MCSRVNGLGGFSHVGWLLALGDCLPWVIVYLGWLFTLDIFLKTTEVPSRHFWLLFNLVKFMYYFDTKCIGLHFGLFFSLTHLVTLIWRYPVHIYKNSWWTCVSRQTTGLLLLLLSDATGPGFPQVPWNGRAFEIGPDQQSQVKDSLFMFANDWVLSTRCLKTGPTDAFLSSRVTKYWNYT